MVPRGLFPGGFSTTVITQTYCLMLIIVGDFNIHIDNTNDALGLAFTDLINSFGVKQNVTGRIHRFNHTLD